MPRLFAHRLLRRVQCPTGNMLQASVSYDIYTDATQYTHPQLRLNYCTRDMLMKLLPSLRPLQCVSSQISFTYVSYACKLPTSVDIHCELTCHKKFQTLSSHLTYLQNGAAVYPRFNYVTVPHVLWGRLTGLRLSSAVHIHTESLISPAFTHGFAGVVAGRRLNMSESSQKCLVDITNRRSQTLAGGCA